MVDMMNTDFKPGDIVQHAAFGPGLVGGGSHRDRPPRTRAPARRRP